MPTVGITVTLRSDRYNGGGTLAGQLFRSGVSGAGEYAALDAAIFVVRFAAAT